MNSKKKNKVTTTTTTQNNESEKDVQQETLPEKANNNNEQNLSDGAVKVISVDLFDPSTGETSTEEIDLNPRRMKYFKDFISDFVKEYYMHPQSPDVVMMKQMDNVRAKFLLETAEENMSDEQLYRDAHELFQCGMLLKEDYNKYSEEATKRIKATIERHAPDIYKRIEDRKTWMNSKVKKG